MQTSIIILTHNRSVLLKKCLASITPQLSKSDEIIVIDNFSIQIEKVKNQSIVNCFSSKNIKYILSEKNSIPFARNLGINLADNQSKIIVFIDDDCCAQYDWLRIIKEKHSHLYHHGIIQGAVISLPKNNFYAKFTSLTYKNWLASNLMMDNTLLTLDSKNISIGTGIFKSGLRFNEQLRRSSDIDFGYRLRKKGFVIIFSEKIVVTHQERTTLRDFLKQHADIAVGESNLKIGIIPPRYNKHLIVFFKLLSEFIKHKEIKDTLLLLGIIPTIVIIRTYVYLTKSVQKL